MGKKIFRRLAAAAMVTALSVGAALMPASSAQAGDTTWPASSKYSANW